MLWFEQPKCSHCLSMMGTSNKAIHAAAILNLHERIENKLFLDRTRKDSNFKRPHIYATLFQIEKCCPCGSELSDRCRQWRSLLPDKAASTRRPGPLPKCGAPACP